MALTQVPASMQESTAQFMGFKNRIINGDMRIDQRNAGASVTITTANQYTVDRWQAIVSQSSKFTAQQNAASITPPVGFTNYIGITSSSAYSVISSDYFLFRQAIEGYNVADLAWGTASAATVTLSFWVRSSLTGAFGGAFTNAAGNRSYPFTYTISAANTWELKTVTIAGDTSGTWLTTNGGGIYVVFGLGVGSTGSGTAGAWAGAAYYSATGATSVVGTSGATFYITGVQLEKGSTATSFDYRPYTTELQLCQRYLPAWSATNGTEFIAALGYGYTTNAYINFNFPVATRVPPTGISVSSFSHINVSSIGGNYTTSAAVIFNNQGTQGGCINFTIATIGATAQTLNLYFTSASGKIQFTGCEL